MLLDVYQYVSGRMFSIPVQINMKYRTFFPKNCPLYLLLHNVPITQADV